MFASVGLNGNEGDHPLDENAHRVIIAERVFHSLGMLFVYFHIWGPFLN